MNSITRQTTLCAPVSLSGKGLHTGLNVNLTLNPAPENTGYLFRRVDIEGENTIAANGDCVKDVVRSTTIARGDIKVSTIEHCLSALYAMGVDNCIIDVDAAECPILDGSAKQYVEAINSVGIKELNAERDYYEITERKVYKSEDGNSSITFVPDSEFAVEVLVEYDDAVVGTQFAALETMKEYAEQIAACRTFVFVREIEPLVNAGLIKGGDLNNAIVVYDRPTEKAVLQNIAAMLGKEAPELDKLGYVNPPLQFNNELARHKLLDLIGDLALLGRPIRGRVIARIPGHAFNTSVVKQIRKEIRKVELFAPIIPQDAQPILDINRIKELLPHRYPFLLVDKVMEMTDSTIIAVKNVTFNEMHFIGHFPDEPVMPGVLHVEAMAQAVGILVLNSVDDPKNYSTYFLKIDNVRFRNKIVPGDTMIMKVSLTTPIRRGLASIKGYCFVNGKIATEAEMTAQIIKNK